MKIKSLSVKNFRCIKEETLSCEELTVLLGSNGCGKSTFLKALDLFYTPSARISEEDFYDENIDEEIVISLTYTDLSDIEKNLFKKYIESETLTVEKVISGGFSGRDSQRYHGSRLKNSEFENFRNATGQELKKEYNKLKNGKYSELSDYTNKDAAESALQFWEESHPDNCTRQRDEGQFFGFKEVGKCNLERHTKYIYIPAVRDASKDAEEGKNSPFSEIMNLVVRNVLAENEELVGLQKELQERYDRIVDPSKLTGLKKIETDLTKTLKTYCPDASVEITWLTEGSVHISSPGADIKLSEDDYITSVERVGHGLQRAFILTMLQHLSIAKSANLENTEEQEVQDATLPMPSLILGIEEPELYQHPNRQRYLAKIFLSLATGKIKGVSDSTQILYSTHSPLFVDIKRFDKIRLLRKAKEIKDKPKVTKVSSTNLDEIAKIIEKADGKPLGSYTGATLAPRLLTLMTPWLNEGFFADVAVLVEGEEDRAAIIGIASAMGFDLESMGISVIPCMGKNNLDRPTAIFQKLGIPVYVIWDSDYRTVDPKPFENHRLLRLLNKPLKDWPEDVTERFACFKEKLGTTLMNELKGGDDEVQKIIDKYCLELSLDKNKDALKNPLVLEKIIKEAKQIGKSSPTLEKIISEIIKLKG